MKILIRGANWIGDAVMSVPAIRELRRIFPAAQFTLHTRAWAKGIFEDSRLFHEIIPIEANGRSKPGTILREATKIRERDYDLAVLFPNSFASAFLARIAGVKLRIGYSTDGRGFLLTDRIPVPEWKGDCHEVFYYLNLAAGVERLLFGRSTVGAINPETSLFVPPQRRERARAMLEAAGVDLSRISVAIAAGSANSRAKRWSAENYARLNNLLQRELNANVILLGAKDEAETSGRIIAFSRHWPIDLTGKTDLSDAAAILAEVDLLVSNDMGLAHLAPAVGTRTLAIFGPTNPVTTKPFSPLADVIRAGVECSPCMLRECPIDHRCMTKIAPEQIFAEAAKILKAKG